MTEETLVVPFDEAELAEDEAIVSGADPNPDAWITGKLADTYGAVPYVPALSTAHLSSREANCNHAGRFSPERVRRYIEVVRSLRVEVERLREEPPCPACGRTLQNEANRGLWRCVQGCGGPPSGELESERQEIERLRNENEKLLDRLRSTLG